MHEKLVAKAARQQAELKQAEEDRFRLHELGANNVLGDTRSTNA